MKRLVVGLIAVCLLPLSSIASEHQDLGKWFITKEVNKLTDKVDYFAVLSPEGGDGALVLRCVNDTTEAYLATDEYLGGGDYTKVTFRIDKQNAITENWVMGGSNDTAFSPIPVKFIKKIYGKQNIVIGYKPYGKTQVIAEFKINHINEVAKEISEACNWKL
ncbi:type VI secretion system-associated protein TagO [Xenorhabdus koppenhoeferi]|uniref:Type VI secretion system VasI, EvfG, VC_A0118 n=1 Tax=Xenorhabdus koppenhoeferi TaxID=351659 RepID=A0A1I7G639_9GAMM|nr:type VI secretion system-associated protein TagO [Xenorhabdus koppenhoeferi]SFU43932.1 Type VI secretion system VasI, EvfG, VC_A0118 [Xenorhabdus koppenhoeferi]